MKTTSHETVGRLAVRPRPFTAEDYPRFIEIGKAAFPDESWNEEEVRHADASWDHTRYFFSRVMAEDAGGQIAGFGRIMHMPWQFDPALYSMNIVVDPAARRRGVGTTLYADLLAVLRQRGAAAVRGGVSKETETVGIEFLTHRGFVEVARGYESRLDVEAFDFDRFAGAEERAAQQGIILTTLAEARKTDPDALRKVYELYVTCGRDAPAVTEVTAAPFEQFLAYDVETPKALPEAFFLARDGDAYVGLSYMHRRLGQPTVLSQELTGLLREYRGRGIAMALKLQTVRYARAHGYREIRTGNDARNRPMLRINEAMGYVKQPAWVVYEKRL